MSVILQGTETGRAQAGGWSAEARPESREDMLTQYRLRVHVRQYTQYVSGFFAQNAVPVLAASSYQLPLRVKYAHKVKPCVILLSYKSIVESG
jgi:hypothetical protein